MDSGSRGGLASAASDCTLVGDCSPTVGVAAVARVRSTGGSVCRAPVVVLPECMPLAMKPAAAQAAMIGMEM
jgi:hypothetical protein